MNHLFKSLSLLGMILLTGCGETTSTDNNISLEDVLDNDKPRIILEGNKTIEIPLGTKNISEAGFSAYDEADGDLTSEVKREHNIDFTQAGEYTIVYSVEDSDGNKDTQYRYVSIVNPLGLGSGDSNSSIDPFYNNGEDYQGSIPEIKLLRNEKIFDGPLYLGLGEEYDIAYSATDFEDGNLGDSVTISGADFDPNKAGTYTVTYSVIDSNKNSVSKSLTVIVGNSTNWNNNTNYDSVVTGVEEFASWYSSECGKTFNRSLYDEETGRYRGAISCSNRGLSYVDLIPMSIFSSIDEIDLSYNNLDDIDFTPLSNTYVIKKIKLNNNNFYNIDLSPLYHLQNIDELWLNGNHLDYSYAEREELYRGFNNRSFTIYFDK
jgi:hypothetical protein